MRIQKADEDGSVEIFVLCDGGHPGSLRDEIGAAFQCIEKWLSRRGVYEECFTVCVKAIDWYRRQIIGYQFGQIFRVMSAVIDGVQAAGQVENGDVEVQVILKKTLQIAIVYHHFGARSYLDDGSQWFHTRGQARRAGQIGEFP